jgi:GMP synthase (glutamine-hydrolysing)
MVQVGGHILGIQGHPEASKAFVKALISSREDRLGGDTVARALTSLEQPVHSESVASWILNFLKL